MAEKFGNDFATTLAAAITTVGQTAITVASGTGAPDVAFRCRIGDELVRVTSKGSGTDWTIERGVEGTTAATHLNGADVVHVLTKEALETYARENATILDATVDEDDTLVIPAGHQMLVGAGYTIDGTLQIDGELHVVS